MSRRMRGRRAQEVGWFVLFGLLALTAGVLAVCGLALGAAGKAPAANRMLEFCRRLHAAGGVTGWGAVVLLAGMGAFVAGWRGISKGFEHGDKSPGERQRTERSDRRGGTDRNNDGVTLRFAILWLLAAATPIVMLIFVARAIMTPGYSLKSSVAATMHPKAVDDANGPGTPHWEEMLDIVTRAWSVDIDATGLCRLKVDCKVERSVSGVTLTAAPMHGSRRRTKIVLKYLASLGAGTGPNQWLYPQYLLSQSYPDLKTETYNLDKNTVQRNGIPEASVTEGQKWVEMVKKAYEDH
jgi:hypothetical protein